QRRLRQREENKQRVERTANATTNQVASAVRPFDAVSSELPTPNGHDFSQVGVLRSDRPATEQAEHVHRAIGNGSSLDPAIRQPLESVFRADFSKVSIHTDSEADDLTRSLNARAFTTGEDIYFNASAYDPSSSRGRELIAHELTHVVQQRSGGPRGGELDVSEPGDVAEQAADPIARDVVSGSSASARAPGAVDTPSIQRTVLDDVKLDVTDAVHDVAEAVGVESTEEADAARLQAFIDHGTFGPQSLVPPTNIGGFDASFDPTSNLLLIQVRTGVNFVNGLEIDGADVITANHDDLAQAAADGNNLAPEDRPTFVDQFTWQPDLQDAFMAQLQARVREAWSGQFLFLCTH